MNHKIYLQIAAWRDQEIAKTIKSAYSNAEYPDNITFAITWQGYKEDDWMLDEIYSLPGNIKIIKLDASTAPLSLCRIRGEIGSSLITDERYFMQVDSHSMFQKQWDTSLISELEIANDFFGKSIITSQATSFWSWDEPFIENDLVTVPNQELFDQIGAPVVGEFYVKRPNTQVREVFFNAGCVFAYIDFVKDVPQPRDILFQYEQPVMGVRAFTAGYNMISPARSYVAVLDFYKNPYGNPQHHTRKNDPLWKEKWGEKEKQNEQLFKDIMSGRIHDPNNGLLSEKTLEEYIDFVGYDPVTLKVFRDHDPYSPGNFILVPQEDIEHKKSIIRQQMI